MYRYAIRSVESSVSSTMNVHRSAGSSGCFVSIATLNKDEFSVVEAPHTNGAFPPCRPSHYTRNNEELLLATQLHNCKEHKKQRIGLDQELTVESPFVNSTCHA
jgi:hypothetical protein